MTTRFRFGLGTSSAASHSAFTETARRAEDQGYSTLLVPDHLRTFSPAVAMATAASVTTTLRLGSFVLNNDFRHPAIVAQETATLDLLSDGRYELGIGAGWNKPEYDAAGIEYDRPSIRIARLDESIRILKRLFAGEAVNLVGDHYTITDHVLTLLPPQGADLPFVIGGNGDKMLTLAAQHAHTVGFTGFTFDGSQAHITHFTTDQLRDRIELVREAAGDRFDAIELNALIQRVVLTDDRRRSAAEFAENWGDGAPEIDDILDSPFVLFGTVPDIADQLRRFRDELGISYWVAAESRSEGFDGVVAKLAGT